MLKVIRKKVKEEGPEDRQCRKHELYELEVNLYDRRKRYSKNI